MMEYASSEAEHPAGLLKTLTSRHKIIKTIRLFFDSQNYIEVETPIRVKCPGIEPYIDAIPAGAGFFLATSPELHMKRLMTEGFSRIYQLTRAFRAEEAGKHHSSEFSMLEWYRTGTDYIGIMDEAENLVRYVIEHSGCLCRKNDVAFKRISVDSIYLENAGWEPSKQWNEDKYFIDWVERIEPCLEKMGMVFLFDFPSALSSLSMIKKDDCRVCERFEIFIDGLEIGNAFTELTDAGQNIVRFRDSQKRRMKMGKEPYPDDRMFFKALKSGFKDCGGIAIGIDRFIMAILSIKDINDVQSFPVSRI